MQYIQESIDKKYQEVENLRQFKLDYERSERNVELLQKRIICLQKNIYDTFLDNDTRNFLDLYIESNFHYSSYISLNKLYLKYTEWYSGEGDTGDIKYRSCCPFKSKRDFAKIINCIYTPSKCGRTRPYYTIYYNIKFK